MIFKRGNGEESSVDVLAVDCISESRSWSRPGMQGVEYSAPLYRYDSQVAIAACRQQKTDGFNHVFAGEDMIESSYVSNQTSEITSLMPLLIEVDQYGRVANFDREKLEKLFSDVEQSKENAKRVDAFHIFDYIYGALHSPSYREKYKEFLKTDFPRVPRPKSWDDFWHKVEQGNKLRELHLMHGVIPGDYPLRGEGDGVVDKPRYADGRAYINSTQYFDNVPETAWNFYIGGYQPAQKWLKDRKGRELGYRDIEHYQRIITILLETDEIMKQIG